MAPRSLRFPLAFAFVACFAALVHGVRSQSGLPSKDRTAPVVVPFLMDSIRVPGVAVGSIMIANASNSESALSIESISVRLNGLELAHTDPKAALVRDMRYARAQSLIELLPHEWTHRTGSAAKQRHFADPAESMFEGAEALERWRELDELAEGLHLDELAGNSLPFIEPKLDIPYDQVFAPWDLPGTERSLDVHVTWRRGQAAAQEVIVSHTVTLLAPRPTAPTTLALGSTTIHVGDLHVHSCHGEAAGACAPSANCTAETLQLSGSFNYAELRSQFTTLGIDWYTATDHSYCINSTTEFNQMDTECLASTDATFLVPMDIELSSAETGPQSGSDAGNILCIFGDAQNHMGAHGITSRIVGGSDGFAGFCNGVSDFDDNATTIRAQGGFPIVHHPDGSSFGWNSRADLEGQEAKQLHGVEIWGGEGSSGQGSDVADWVEWLLDGRILYCYSGSDTHDTAFDFGANHAIFHGEPFTEAGLFSVLEKGRLFLSDGPAAVLEIGFEGTTLEMGAIQSLSPNQAASTLDVDVHLELGASIANITLFRGRVGDSAEAIVATGASLSGSTVFSHSEALDPAARTWFRAYVETTGGEAAYTNPIFFVPNTCTIDAYGTGLGGTNTASLSSTSSPTLGSQITLNLGGFPPTAPIALLVYSFAQLPPFAFGGGFLLVAPPFAFQTLVPLSSGSGSFTLAVPNNDSILGVTAHFQAGAQSGTPGVFNLSNGVTATLCDLLQ